MKLKKICSVVVAAALTFSLSVTPILADEVSDLKKQKKDTEEPDLTHITFHITFSKILFQCMPEKGFIFLDGSFQLFKLSETKGNGKSFPC